MVPWLHLSSLHHSATGDSVPRKTSILRCAFHPLSIWKRGLTEEERANVPRQLSPGCELQKGIQEDSSRKVPLWGWSSLWLAAHTSKCPMSHSEPDQPASSCFEVSRKVHDTAQVRRQHPKTAPMCTAPPNMQSTYAIWTTLPCDNYHLKWGICYFVGRRQTPIASIQAQIHTRFKTRSVLTYSAFENLLHPWFLGVVS